MGSSMRLRSPSANASTPSGAAPGMTFSCSNSLCVLKMMSGTFWSPGRGAGPSSRADTRFRRSRRRAPGAVRSQGSSRSRSDPSCRCASRSCRSESGSCRSREQTSTVRSSTPADTAMTSRGNDSRRKHGAWRACAWGSPRKNGVGHRLVCDLTVIVLELSQ